MKASKVRAERFEPRVVAALSTDQRAPRLRLHHLGEKSGRAVAKTRLHRPDLLALPRERPSQHLACQPALSSPGARIRAGQGAKGRACTSHEVAVLL